MSRWVNADINGRIEAIYNDLFRGNLTDMAKTTYISRTTLSSIIGEQQSKPGYDVLRKLVEMETFRINERWLLTGRGNMLDPSDDAPRKDYQMHSGNAGNNSQQGNRVKIKDVEGSFNPGQNDTETIKKLTDIIDSQRKRIDELTDKIIEMASK